MMQENTLALDELESILGDIEEQVFWAGVHAESLVPATLDDPRRLRACMDQIEILRANLLTVSHVCTGRYLRSYTEFVE